MGCAFICTRKHDPAGRTQATLKPTPTPTWHLHLHPHPHIHPNSHKTHEQRSRPHSSSSETRIPCPSLGLLVLCASVCIGEGFLPLQMTATNSLQLKRFSRHGHDQTRQHTSGPDSTLALCIHANLLCNNNTLCIFPFDFPLQNHFSAIHTRQVFRFVTR